MQKWLTGIRGAVMMGLTWAVGWGLGAGGVMEAFIDPRGAILDMWPQTLGIPALIGGLIFSAVVRITEGRRGFDELPLPRVVAWGAVTGLLLGVLALSMGVASDEFAGPWQHARVIFGITTPLSMVSAVLSVSLFRYVARERAPAGAGAG